MWTLCAPMKVGHDTAQGLRRVKSWHWRVGSLTEMDLGARTANGLARQILGRTVRVLTRDLGEHSEECPILLRRDPHVRLLDFRVWKLSADDGGKGFGNDRWLARVTFRVWGRTYVVFATHLDAVVQRVSGDGSIIHGDRWELYKRSVDRLERHVQDAIDDPSVDCVVVQGDVNMMPFGEGAKDPHSPYVVLHRLGFQVRNERVTMVAVHGADIVRTKTYPPGQAGWPSDHAALAVQTARPRRKAAHRP